jgi:hypothetical protein
MIKRLALFALLACCAGFAQTTAFTANLKDLVGNIPGAYVELSLKNCAGAGSTPTIPHVNGVGVISFPVQLYPNPSTGLVSGNPYDETGIVCGSSTGVSYYHIAIYQGDATRSLVKKLLFADDFDVQGASFNLNSATPRSGSVITPPVATAVLTNPAGNQTIVQPVGTALSINHLSAGFAQAANNTKMIPATRFTDTSPTGDFLDFTNATGATHLWEVDVTGSLLNGIIPTARLSGTIPAASLPNPSATTLGGIESLAAVASKWINTISTSGVPSATQPNFTDLAGIGTCAQEPALTGDTTTSAGSCATTTAKVNGVSYPAAPSTHAVPVTTAANTETYKIVPDCTDTTGNHINYTQSTDAFSCGTSVPANTVTTTGTQTLSAKTLTAPILTGTAPYNRLRANQGTALVTGDVSGLTNFGTTASVSAVSGTDSAGTISILSNGTGQIANGSFTLTFHDGTWPTAPVCVANRGDANGPNAAMIASSSSATTAGFAFGGAAAAGVTYIFNFICVGK